MGDSLGAGGFPAGQDLRTGDDVAGSGVPGLLTGKLEQERLASADLRDRLRGVGIHTNATDAAQVVCHGPALDNEWLHSIGEVFVGDRGEGRGLESPGESGPDPRTGRVGEVGQPGQIRSDRQ